MLTHINKYQEFIDQVSKLNNFPEITTDESMHLGLGNFDIEKRNPIHSGKYDERLFGELSNIFRKLVILSQKEEPSLVNIHESLVESDHYQDLNRIKKSIDEYLEKNINEVTSCSFSFPDSVLETTSVKELLKNYFAALHQHSKPEPQLLIDKINYLTYGNVTEMVRRMMIDIIKILNEYAGLLEAISKNRLH